MQRRVTVTHGLEDGALLDAVRSLGMDAEIARAPGETSETGPQETAAYGSRFSAAEWGPAAASGALAFAAELLSWGSAGEHHPAVIAIAVASILLSGRKTMVKGWLAVKNLTLNIHFLMSLAVAGAMIIGEWPEAAMVTFLFAVAEKLEAYSLERARQAIQSLIELAPDTVVVRGDGGVWQEIAADQVKAGRIVRVRPGDRIPLDGTVTSGESSVNQAPITGESMAVEKGPGDPLFAGTVNEHGALEFEVTAPKGSTTLDRIIRIVEQAQASRAPTERIVDRMARYYTPAVLILAALVALVPPLAGGQEFVPWFYRALVLLVIACPCALVISTPVTVVSGLAAAARLGILIKGGVYLERGKELRLIALDKTGTLTLGRPAVTDVEPLGNLSREEVLHWAASLNALSEHPVASAIVGHCSTAHGDRECNLLPVTDFEALPGRGVKGALRGEMHYAGSHRLAHDNLRCGAEVESILTRLEREGKTTIVLTTEEKPLAVLGVADTLRETSVEAIRELHRLGIRTMMLTGDNQTTAEAVARKAGISEVRGNLLPQDKLAIIEDLLREQGNVGMVGDGINDAPALARASIGFAMGAAGSGAALETADVALMEDDLRRLPLFIRLSRATSSLLAQNIAISILIKAVFFGLALAGFASLWMAVFADMGASLIVIYNGLRLLRFGGGSAAPANAPAGARA